MVNVDEEDIYKIEKLQKICESWTLRNTEGSDDQKL
jgi:hypothetical protein